MSIFQDSGSIPRNEVFRSIKVWACQLIVLCLSGITIAIVRWSETGLWITTLSLIVIWAIVLLLKILRAVKFLEQETEKPQVPLDLLLERGDDAEHRRDDRSRTRVPRGPA
jgi:hypothetical protein